MPIIPKAPQSEEISNFPIWLHEQIVENTKNFTIPLIATEKELELLSEWSDETKPIMMGITLNQALDSAYKWYNKNLAKQYKTNNVVYKWKDGWKVVQVPLSSFSSRTDPTTHINDLDIERELMNTGSIDQTDMIAVYGRYNTVFQNHQELETEIIIYSLRDPSNVPQATIEITYNKDNPYNIYLREVFSSKDLDADNQHPQKEKIKEFFNFLKSKGYRFGGIDQENYSSDINLQKLDEEEWEDQFGIPYNISGVGGSNEQYFENLQDAYGAGGEGSYWYQSSSFRAVDNLILYAEERGELNLLESALEGYPIKKINNKTGKYMNVTEGFNDLALQWWIETDDNMNYENPYPGDEPSKDDFTTPPDPKQPPIPGLPKPEPIFDQEAYEESLKEYNEKLKAYEEERLKMEEYFEPYIFQNYVYEELQKAKQREQMKPKNIKPITVSNMKTKIYKISDRKINDRLPDNESLSLYVQSLKQYLKDNSNLCEEWKDLIEKMPSARKVRQDLSFQECKILYETLEYLWEKITKEKIISEKEIIRAPESLDGNYWMMNNGILLQGVNSYDIVKRNVNLFCSLLNIGGMTMQEYLSRKPNDLIKFIIKNGGLRLFVTKDKRFYSQCSPEIYGKWARDKIRKLDFKKKIIKLIDLNTEYNGWDSGITIILP